MLVLASHQARERLLSKCNEQGIAGLSDFMKEGRLLCCKSESLSCCWFAFMSCCVAGLAFFGSSRFFALSEQDKGAHSPQALLCPPQALLRADPLLM